MRVAAKLLNHCWTQFNMAMKQAKSIAKQMPVELENHACKPTILQEFIITRKRASQILSCDCSIEIINSLP